MWAKKAAKKRKHNTPIQRGVIAGEQSRNHAKQSLTVCHTNVHPTSHEFNDYLLDLHQPDPMALPHEEAWPSSDVDPTDSLHGNSDVTHDLDNEMLGGVLDFDLDEIHDVVDSGSNQTPSGNRVKVMK